MAQKAPKRDLCDLRRQLKALFLCVLGALLLYFFALWLLIIEFLQH